MAYPLLLNTCVARRISIAAEILMPFDGDEGLIASLSSTWSARKARRRNASRSYWQKSFKPR
jgi:hypothetical protein